MQSEIKRASTAHYILTRENSFVVELKRLFVFFSVDYAKRFFDEKLQYAKVLHSTDSFG